MKYGFFTGLTDGGRVLNKLHEIITTTPTYPVFDAAGDPDQNVANKWTVLYTEQELQTINGEDVNCFTKLYIKGITDEGKEMYFGFTNDFNLQYITCTMYDQLGGNEGGLEPTFGLASPSAKWSWMKTDTGAEIETPINYWVNMSNNKLAIVLQGDPTRDFNAYQIAFGYFGAISPFDVPEDIDIDGNVAMTVGNSLSSSSTPNTFGPYTSNGVDTICMLKTKSGIKFQKHYAAFITQDPKLELEIHGFNASRWTQKYHLTPIYVVHPYDGYRGKLDGVVGVDKNNILHLDELLVDREDGYKDLYQYFDCNATHNFLTSSPHENYGLVILKGVRS